MLRRSKAVSNLNEILNEEPKQDHANTLLDAILSNPIVEYGEGNAHTLFKKQKPPASTPILIPAMPVKKPSDDDLRGISVFTYSENKHQMLEQAKRDKCLAKAVFGFERKF